MGCRRVLVGWLGVLLWAVAVGRAWAQGGKEGPLAAPESAPAAGASGFAPVRVPLEQLPAEVRERVRAVVEQHTLSTRGPVEVFTCQPAVYQWLLDHPDQTVRLWRSLGAKVTDIQDRGNGVFGWQDNQGGNIRWETVLRSPRQRVWYAEGQVRPGVLLPAVPVQAVVVLDLTEGHDLEGRPALRHQMSLLVHTDSQAVALAARLLGASVPRVAEQYVAQMEMFFAAMAWYLDQHPRQAERLFGELQRPQGAEVSRQAPAGRP
jgi:hypothetical protein